MNLNAFFSEPYHTQQLTIHLQIHHKIRGTGEIRVPSAGLEPVRWNTTARLERFFFENILCLI